MENLRRKSKVEIRSRRKIWVKIENLGMEKIYGRRKSMEEKIYGRRKYIVGENLWKEKIYGGNKI